MEPDQPISNPPQSPPPADEQLAAVVPPESPSLVQPTPVDYPNQLVEKKSKKKLIIIIAVIAVVVIAIAAYAVYALSQKPADNNDKTGSKEQTAQNATTNNQNVNTAKDLLVGLSGTETALADTDQSSLATDINNAVNTVGSSVNENSF